MSSRSIHGHTGDEKPVMFQPVNHKNKTNSNERQRFLLAVAHRPSASQGPSVVLPKTHDMETYQLQVQSRHDEDGATASCCGSIVKLLRDALGSQRLVFHSIDEQIKDQHTNSSAAIVSHFPISQIVALAGGTVGRDYSLVLRDQ